MINPSIKMKQGTARTQLLRKVILSAPFWAAGLLFIAVVISLLENASLGSLRFVAISLVIMLASTIAAFRLIDHDAQRGHVKRSPLHRGMQLRSRRLRAVRRIAA